MNAAELRHPGPALRAALLEIVREIEGHAGRLADPAEAADAVHRIRTCSKRFRALLRLGGRAIPSRQRSAARTAVRKLKRSVSAARDAHVVVERFREVAGPGLPAPGIRRRTDPAAARVAALADGLRAAAEGLEMEELRVEDVLGAFCENYRRGRDDFAACGDHPADERLHDWRKRIKGLAYQAAELSLLAPAATIAQRGKALGTLLGDHHDFAVLAHHLDPRRKTHARLLRKVEARKARLTRACLKAGAKLFAGEPEKLAARLRRAALALDPES